MLLTACATDAPPLTTEWRWQAPAPAYVGMPAAAGSAVAATYGHSYLALIERGERRWQAKLLGLRDTAPTFHGGSVFAATDSGVAAFAGGNGAVLWHRDVGDRASTPVIIGGRVVVTTWGGRVVMLDGWSVTLPGPSLGPPAAGRGVVVASWDGGVIGLDGGSGAVRWRREFDGAGTSAPAIVDGLAVVVASDRRAHAFDLRSGDERWSVRMNGAGAPEAPPAVRGNEVAIVDRLGHLAVVEVSGKVRWTGEGRGAVVRGGPAWVGDAVAVPLDAGRVMLATRRQILFHDPPGRVSGVAATGNTLVLATREATTNELSAKTHR
jgi:outer membrane protein assembly factor BamB